MVPQVGNCNSFTLTHVSGPWVGLYGANGINHGKIPHCCTTTGLDNPTEIQTKKIHPAVLRDKHFDPWASPYGSGGQIPITLQNYKCEQSTELRNNPFSGFRDIMMTSSNGNIFRVTGPLRREFTGHRWIPRTKASDAELWRFLWSVPE